jgi:hypothetical protein
VPPPMVMSKVATSPDGDTAIGQKADPAAPKVAGVSCSSEPGEVPSSDALPFVFHPPAVGSGMTTPVVPVPVIVVEAEPAEVATVSVAVATDVSVGAKVIVAMTDWPAASDAPTAGKPVADNGADGPDMELIVNGLPPVLAIVTVRVVLVPIETDPKSMAPGVTDRTPGREAPTPVRDTVAFPADVARLSAPVAVPDAVGANVAVAMTVVPGAIAVPAAGHPITLYGAEGEVPDVTVRGLPPVLLMLIVRDAEDPVVTVP